MKKLYFLSFLFFAVGGFGQCWVQVAAGNYHTLAIKSDGTLWAWGLNDKGQLGIGSTTNSLAPVQVGTDNDWAIIDAEGYNSLALKTDGSMWAWGYNVGGQNGNGNHGVGMMDLAPIQIGTDHDWIKIAPARAFAIKANGTLWGWGDNSDGRLGTGDTDPHYTPIQIGTDSDWTDVSAGGNQTLALKSDHTLWGWGLNKNGSLAIGAVNNFVLVPTQTGNGTADWAKISVGGCCSSKMIKTDGTLWAMGIGVWGNNGNGATDDLNVPTQAGSSSDWLTISTVNSTAGLKNDGTLWSWGSNYAGQLGNGNTSNVLTPAQIGSSQWQSVKGGFNYFVAIDHQGSLYTWGWNNNGQLGTGALVDQNMPVQIGSTCVLSTTTFEKNRIVVHPNPVVDIATVDFHLDGEEQVTVTATNSIGQILLRNIFPGKPGSNSLSIDFSHFPVGSYLLTFESGSQKWHSKILKQ